MTAQPHTLWGGRFEQAASPLLRQFNDSLPFDQRLWLEDIFGSMAYANAIAAAGLLTAAERDSLLAGLEQVAAEWRSGEFTVAAGDEDIHTAVERRLGELIGPTAGKLHTGRSRNDQVATDQRWWLRNRVDELDALLAGLLQVAVDRAAAEIDVLMPGYTHVQPAQPIRWAHWLLSHAWAWQRDRQRLDELRARLNQCPLGAGALAGTPFAVDRAALAAELGFAAPIPNSIDAVRDRDYVVEFLGWAALLGAHLSQIAEDLIWWSSKEFGFVRVADAWSTGSSLMPQKRNPDSLELLRGKAGRLTGNLVSVLAMLKSLPAAYNKDLQEDKEPLFDSVDTLRVALPVMQEVLATLTINQQRMRAALVDELLATDLADYLVRRGVPFRQSHELVGLVVKRSEALHTPLSALPAAEYAAISPHFGADVAEVFDFERSVEQRAAVGGTARAAVEAQIAALRGLLSPMNTPHPFPVVHLQIADYAEIVALWQRAGLHIRPQGRDRAEAFERQMRTGVQTAIGLRDGERLAAVALATHDSRKGWINRLAVDPEYRRRGLGMQLIRLCEEHFRQQGIEVWAALIEDWNAASLALFRKAGYDLSDAITYASRRARADE